MSLFDYFAQMQTVLRWAPIIKEYMDAGRPIVEAFQGHKPAEEVIDILEEQGMKMFPSLSDKIMRVAAAATALFDPFGTEYIQRALNKLQGAGLAEDGLYGPATKEAVEEYQRRHQPEAGRPDGWVGPKTKALIVAEMAQVSS